MPKSLSKKTSQKTSQKSILASIFLGSPNLAKSTQHRETSKKNAFEKKSENQTPCTVGGLTEVKPFRTQPDHPTTFPMISTSPSIHWLSLGRPNHCLSSQILPKISKNPFKIHPKILPNRPRTLPEPSQIRSKIPSMLQKRSEYDFFNFLSIFGGPWASQIWAKIAKNWKKLVKNRCRKNTCFATPFFHDFLSFRPPKKNLKSRLFR